jgi:hypothetical protein
LAYKLRLGVGQKGDKAVPVAPMVAAITAQYPDTPEGNMALMRDTKETDLTKLLFGGNGAFGGRERLKASPGTQFKKQPN